MPLSGVDAVALTGSFIWFGASIIHVRILASSASSAPMRAQAVGNREPGNRRPILLQPQGLTVGLQRPKAQPRGKYLRSLEEHKVGAAVWVEG